MKFPAVFIGHGSPMLALENNMKTLTLKKMGDYILKTYGKPKAILMVSAHWYQNDTFVSCAKEPKQINDMYGFPDELYALKYPVKGDPELAEKVVKMLPGIASINNDWGIDHGVWTPLIHMFPKADIPIVEMSVNARLDAKGSYLVGQVLGDLREQGYLVMGSGNVVHNLRETDWNNPHGSKQADAFDTYIHDAITRKDYDAVIDYKSHPDSRYAVPTPDHFLPLLYVLGAAGQDDVKVFNYFRELGSMSQTCYLFE